MYFAYLCCLCDVSLYLLKDILLFPRTIGNAALAIVKGYIRPVDVMEIKVSFYHD